MNLSVIIPTWSGTPELAEMALNLAKQVRPMCDELIITEDGDYYKELKEIADIYLIHPRVGHIKNLDLGIKASHGDFIAVLDSDITIKTGSLRDLCIPGRVACGKWSELREHTGFWAWCFVGDRKIFENPEYAIAVDVAHEGLDGWGVTIDRSGLFIWLDVMEYSHRRAQSYSELRRQRDLEAQRPDPNRREVSWDRHRSRLTNDPEYAKVWANEEER